MNAEQFVGELRADCPTCGAAITKREVEWSDCIHEEGEAPNRKWMFPVAKKIIVTCLNGHEHPAIKHEWSMDHGHRFAALT